MSNTAEVVELHEEPTLEDRINHALSLRDRKNALNDQIKEIEAEYKAEQIEIIGMMEAMGIEKSGTTQASCSISRKEVPTLTDFEALQDWVIRTGNLHIFQKRISSTVWKDLELLETNGIPGIDTSDIVTLNLRKSR